MQYLHVQEMTSCLFTLACDSTLPSYLMAILEALSIMPLYPYGSHVILVIPTCPSPLDS